jgi:deoxyribonuclease-4
MTSKIEFGTAGIPISSKERNSVAGIERVKELGLDAMEIEFVRGVRMGEETARQVGKTAAENGIALSVHAPYFINLNSEEKEKVEASKRRIWNSLRIGEICGAETVTFHPAFLGKSSREQCMQSVEEALGELLDRLENTTCA